MAQGTSFDVRYLAGMGALALLATLAGLSLTGERHSGFVGSIEVAALLVGVALFLAAGVGATTSPGASWPLLCAVAAVIVVAVLAFLTATLPEPGPALLVEFAALALGVLLVVTLRRR